MSWSVLRMRPPLTAPAGEGAEYRESGARLMPQGGDM